MKHSLEGWICAILFLAMTALGFANVVVRYLTSYSFAATQELLLTGFLLITVFGAALAAREGQHLAVTFFAGLFGTRVERAVTLFAAGVSLVLLLLAAWFTLDLLRGQIATGVTTPGLGLPAWYYSAPLPLAFALIALRTVQGAIADLRAPTPRSPIDA